jgi:hypothetical protein
MACFGTIGRVGLGALALALLLQAGALAAEPSTRGEVIEGQDQLFQQFPDRFAIIPQGAKTGVQIRIGTGAWLPFTDNVFNKTPPTLCWYAPKLSVAGVCMVGDDVSLTVLVDLKTGRRLQAPGLARLTPDPRLIAVGPGGPHNSATDSITLIRASADGLVDEGGATFDDGFAPGDWKDARCYRLTPPTGGAAMWLERSSDGSWRTAPADQSACRRKYGG